jgi:uncharacterized membrane protein YfcA
MEPTIFLFILVGFVSQIIDGSLGMAFGISSTSMLLSFGISPAAASASVHLAKVFTTAASGLAHWKFGNVDKKIVLRLLIPGSIGGVIGAYLVTAVPEDVIRPFVSIYLIVMAVVIFWNMFRKNQEYRRVTTKLFPLGMIGGLFDAVGGGWGPIVTSTLLARGNWPRQTIGSVNLAEFGVTIVQSITFFLTIGFSNWQIVSGLIIGGVVAAPLAPVVIRYIPNRVLVKMVGFIVALLSIRMIFLAFAR